MSVTFSIPGIELEVPCQCGQKSEDCDWQAQEWKCDQCYDMGTIPNPMGCDFNVANGSAAIILFELLGYGRAEQDVYGGELDPNDVLRRLATVNLRIEGSMREGRVERVERVKLTDEGVDAVRGPTIYHPTIGEARLCGYVERMTKLARSASEIGEQITYG